MDEIPYYGYEEGWKKRFELTIPILLLVLVLLVLALKMGWLCAIPGISDIACGGTVSNVLIIGDDRNVELMLSDVGLSLNHEIMNADEISALRDATFLEKYDLIILTEETSNTKGALPNAFRGYLAQSLPNKKFILFGIAGHFDTGEPTLNGWTASGMGNYVPVNCKTVDCATDSHSVSQMSFRIQDIEHTVFDGYNPTQAIPITGTASFEYLPVNLAGGNSLGVIESEVGTATLSEFGVVEGSNGITGKTIYFAYHPSRTPTIFKNTINYLLGGNV